MNRNEIVTAMAKANNISMVRARKYFDMVVDAIEESLIATGKVDVHGHFKLEVTETKPRMMKSNLTQLGEVYVPPKKKVKLVFYKQIKEMIDGMRLN